MWMRYEAGDCDNSFQGCPKMVGSVKQHTFYHDFKFTYSKMDSFEHSIQADHVVQTPASYHILTQARIGKGRRSGRGGDKGSGERGEAEGEGRKEGIVRRKMRDEVDGREGGERKGMGTTGGYWYYRPLRWCSAVSTRCLLSHDRWQHTLTLPTSSLHLSLLEDTTSRSRGNTSITRRLRLTRLKDVWRVR